MALNRGGQRCDRGPTNNDKLSASGQGHMRAGNVMDRRSMDKKASRNDAQGYREVPMVSNLREL
jgi:hypothetical protein